jgi:hypothetical protein
MFFFHIFATRPLTATSHVLLNSLFITACGSLALRSTIDLFPLIAVLQGHPHCLLSLFVHTPFHKRGFGDDKESGKRKLCTMAKGIQKEVAGQRQNTATGDYEEKKKWTTAVTTTTV